MSNHRDWYVITKINIPTDDAATATDLEQHAENVAREVECIFQGDFGSSHIVMDDGYGNLVRPHWAKDHKLP